MLRFNTINNDVRLYFATPIALRAWSDADRYNASLRDLILKRRAEDSGVIISNRGGWQSKDDFFTWSGEAVAAITTWFHVSVMHVLQSIHGPEFAHRAREQGDAIGWRGTAWANINGRGDSNDMHNHAASHWSGVYYVQVPEKAGELCLFDPRPNINMTNSGNQFLDIFQQSPERIEPRVGTMVIFPSWLQHSVSAQQSDEERISIAFNLRFLTGYWTEQHPPGGQS